MLVRDFTVTTHEREYSDTFPRYDRVAVETGWVRVQAGGKVLLNERIETDPELFWDHYQSQTLPRIFKYLMAQADGRPKQEYQPLFDTLLIDTHMSEPDYNLGLDKERISSLEMAMQEDLFYSTGNFFDMMGNLETGKPFAYPGRIITVVHPSDDGHDGRVRVEFYAKPAANPLVRLRWTDANGTPHEREARPAGDCRTDVAASDRGAREGGGERHRVADVAVTGRLPARRERRVAARGGSRSDRAPGRLDRGRARTNRMARAAARGGRVPG